VTAATAHDIQALQRRTLTVLVVAQVIGTVAVGVAPSLGVLLAERVTHSETWAGVARSVSTLGVAIVSLPLGAYAARHGRRRALATGWLIAAAGAGLLTIAAQRSSVLLLFPGLLMIGAALATSLQSRFAATDLAEPLRSGRALALIVWVGTLGSVLGPNLGIPGRALGSAVGLNVYAASFLIAAVSLLFAALVIGVALRPDPLLERQRIDRRAAPVPARRSGSVRHLAGELRANRRARLAVVAVVSAQVVMVSVMTMTPVQVEHEGGGITIVGITISLHIVGMYCFAPIVGRLVDSRGARVVIVLGVGVLAVALALAALEAGELHGIMVALFLVGVGWSFANVAGSALFTLSVDPATRAASQGGLDSMANYAGAAAAFAAGPLMSATGFATLSAIALVLLAPLAAMLTATRTTRAATPTPS
jgi:predicted MFS family arabinose efflux permease